MSIHLGLNQIEQLERIEKINLIQSLSGFHSPCMIATLSHRKIPNIGLFNSVIHVGSAPALMGFMIRPLTVPRHTYHNILANGYFTINHVSKEILENAHRTSGNFPENISEFESCNLTEEYSDTLPTPYVKESFLKIGLRNEEEHKFKANGNIFIIGAVQEIIMETNTPDYFFHQGLAVLGLEDYGKVEKLKSLGYVRT
jgi:flavin reductase (DIM6/NTAB) family NADH-FMN oxidoreductase RutF